MKVSGRTLIGPFGSIAATACHRKQRIQREIEANRFAAELLMPYDMIMKDLATYALDIEDETELGMLAGQVRRELAGADAAAQECRRGCAVLRSASARGTFIRC